MRKLLTTGLLLTMLSMPSNVNAQRFIDRANNAIERVNRALEQAQPATPNPRPTETVRENNTRVVPAVATTTTIHNITLRYPRLSSRNAFFVNAKLRDWTVDATTSSYITIFKRGEFERANEFERRRIRSEAETIVRNGLESANDIIAGTYTASFEASLSAYDFNRGGFHLNLSRGYGALRSSQGAVVVLFCVPAIFISMPEEQAEQFLQRLPTRTVRVFVEYRIVGHYPSQSDIPEECRWLGSHYVFPQYLKSQMIVAHVYALTRDYWRNSAERARLGEFLFSLDIP